MQLSAVIPTLLYWMWVHNYNFDNCIFVVMDNYNNAPKHLYGLSPSQMDMFMTEDNPVRRQSEKVTEVFLLYIFLSLLMSKIW